MCRACVPLAGGRGAVGKDPDAFVITPNGQTAYVVNYYSDTISVINTATNATNAVSAPIDVGADPGAIAIAP